MAWGKSKKPTPWGKRAKKADDAGSALSVLQRKLAKIKKAAPPDPDEALLGWMVYAYGQYRALDVGEREELRARAKSKGKKMRTGDVVLSQFIDETAADHVGDKQKKKYCAIFEQAQANNITHWGLRKFIHDCGGVTRCAAGWKPTPTKPEPTKPKPPSPKPILPKPKGRKSRRRRRGGHIPSGSSRSRVSTRPEDHSSGFFFDHGPLTTEPRGPWG